MKLIIVVAAILSTAMANPNPSGETGAACLPEGRLCYDFQGPRGNCCEGFKCTAVGPEQGFCYKEREA
ncbi:hypothetical protein AWENTII_008321 [Aspergillus wentii]|nr:hypothetical protein MW887_008244 [Aspergillus wentii]